MTRPRRARPGEVLSAQVVLRGHGGASPSGDAVITAQTIDDFRPDADAARAIAHEFAARGFEVGSLVGNSFSITGPANLFERTFGAKLRKSKRAGMQVQSEGAVLGEELPLTRLDPSARDWIAAVTFTPPPDFGPTNFGP